MKAHPFVTKEEYLWDWSYAQVRLAMIDSTHVEYEKTKSDTKNKKSKQAKKIPKNIMKLGSVQDIEDWTRATGGKV